MPRAILGISAYYHDSAAVLLVDGKIVAGVGNIYASEVLFQAQIHPDTPAYTLPLKKLTSSLALKDGDSC